MATIRQRVEEILKTGWVSNFQLNMILRTSSADREARRIKENPPAGYKFVTRKKKIKGYNPCYEFMLEELTEN